MNAVCDYDYKMEVGIIISGGQTGADRAALDTALELGIPHGGAVPRGRKTEDGTLPEHYQLKELQSEEYDCRTERNVRDADGTLIVSHGELTGGSALTAKLAARIFRPWLHINLNEIDPETAGRTINSWLRKNDIRILNVAGPRASEDSTIYPAVRKLLNLVFHPKKEILRLKHRENRTTL